MPDPPVHRPHIHAFTNRGDGVFYHPDHDDASLIKNPYHHVHLGQQVAEVRTNGGEAEGENDLDVLHMLTPETAEILSDLMRSATHESERNGRHRDTSKPDYNNPLQFNRKIFKLEDTIDPYYLYSWLTFILIVLLVAAIEVPVMAVCLNTSLTAPLMMLTTAASAVANSYEQLGNINSTVPAPTRLLTLLQSVENLEKQYRISKDIGDRAWTPQLIACVVHFVLTVSVVIMLFIFRNTKAIQTRGSQFLLQSFGSGLCLQLVYTPVAAAFCMKFTEIPLDISFDSVDILYAEQTELLNLVTCGALTALFLICIFAGSVVQRQRLIYLVFCGPLRPRMKIRYLETFPINVLIFLLSCPPYLIWRYATSHGNEITWVSGAIFWLPVVIFPVWAGYYVHKTKYIHRDYTDFHSNMRMILYYTVVSLCIILYSALGPGDSFVVLDLGWQAVGRSMVTVHALESAACLYFQTRHVQRSAEEPNPQAFVPPPPTRRPRHARPNVDWTTTVGSVTGV